MTPQRQAWLLREFATYNQCEGAYFYTDLIRAGVTNDELSELRENLLVKVEGSGWWITQLGLDALKEAQDERHEPGGRA